MKLADSAVVGGPDGKWTYVGKEKQVKQALAEGRPVLLLYQPPQGGSRTLLVASAETLRPETLNFMLRDGSGTISVPLPPERLRYLDLPAQAGGGPVPYSVSVAAKGSVSTGVAVADRHRTISLLADSRAAPTDFVRPGHVFPIAADLRKPAANWIEPESALALITAFGLGTSAVLCTNLSQDGQLSSGKEWDKRSAGVGIPIVQTADVHDWFRMFCPQVGRMRECTDLETPYGILSRRSFRGRTGGTFDVYHTPDLRSHLPGRVRLVRQCPHHQLGHPVVCDCQAALHRALRRTAANRNAALICLPAVADTRPTQEEVSEWAWILKRMQVGHILLSDTPFAQDGLLSLGLKVQSSDSEPYRPLWLDQSRRARRNRGHSIRS